MEMDEYGVILEGEVHEAINNFSVALQENGGTIELQTAGVDLWVKGDKLHLVNLLNNLLDNAIKYVKRPPVITIAFTQTITAANKKRFSFRKQKVKAVSISVTDNGIGIAPENLKRVFQRFYRVPTGNVHNVKGFGIGLHYVKLMAEAHGGHVAATSTVGTGSTFTVTLPLHEKS